MDTAQLKQHDMHYLEKNNLEHKETINTLSKTKYRKILSQTSIFREFIYGIVISIWHTIGKC